MSTSKQTLKQAVYLVRSGLGLRDVTRAGLSGCPVGEWAETDQAKSRMCEALPHRSMRAYTVDELVAELYVENSAGRYEYRDIEMGDQ